MDGGNRLDTVGRLLARTHKFSIRSRSVDLSAISRPVFRDLQLLINFITYICKQMNLEKQMNLIMIIYNCLNEYHQAKFLIGYAPGNQIYQRSAFC